MREADGRLYGRGACDMKGFAACVLAFVPDFLAAPLKRPVHVVLSYDEETTCLGSTDVIAWFGREEPRPAAVVVGEPTMMDVADAHKSVATIHTVVKGHEAHSALPALGQRRRNCRRYRRRDRSPRPRIREGPFDPRFAPPFDAAVGVIHGGTARNILARECAFDWEFRGLPGVPSVAPIAQVQAFIDTVALPRLTRYVSGPSIATKIEADAPPLGAEPGSVAETLALRLTRSNRTIAVSFATNRGISRRRAFPPSSAVRARSIRRTSRTNMSRSRSLRPAWPFSPISPANCRARPIRGATGSGLNFTSRQNIIGTLRSVVEGGGNNIEKIMWTSAHAALSVIRGDSARDPRRRAFYHTEQNARGVVGLASTLLLVVH